MEKNIREKCLPIDYFVKRMFQIGLVSSMASMNQFIKIMLQFDNAGFTDKGPEYVCKRNLPPEHRVHGLIMFNGETPY
jgi:hypothetical protein